MLSFAAGKIPHRGGVRHRRLRRVLVALDGSPGSEAALDLALDWAQDAGADLLGLGIVDEPAIRKPVAMPPGAFHYKTERDDQLVADAHGRVLDVLAAFARRCAERGVPCTPVEDVGVPYAQIVVEAERADLVVLPRHTHFRFETSEGDDDTLVRVLRLSPRPVVTVADKPVGHGPVVVAYGGLHSVRALHLFTAYAVDAGAEVWLLTVGPDEAAGAERLERALDFLGAHGVAARACVVPTRRPAADVIVETVREADARLLVMGTYAPRPVGGLLFGSVTRAVLQRTDVPLFLYQ